MISRCLSRRLFTLVALILAFATPLLAAGPAGAHAIIVSSKPAANSEVPQGAVDILLQFNSRIDIDHSRISLVDPAGKVTALKVADESAPGSLAAHGTTDAPGTWTIRWQVLSVDGHITRGEIPFKAMAPAP